MAKRKPAPKTDPEEELNNRLLAIEDSISGVEKRVFAIEQKADTQKPEPSHIQWAAPVIVVAILSALIFFVWPRGGERNPPPDPFSIIENEKANPTPIVAEKKLQGTLLIIHNLDPMTDPVAKMIEQADAYREKVGKSVFDYLSLDEKSQNTKVLQLIKSAGEQNIRPPFIVFKQAGATDYKYAPRPATFSEIVNTYGR